MALSVIMDQTKYKQKLEIGVDREANPILILQDWDHRDYIEDVLCEHYDIEYEYMVEDEISGSNTLYFGTKISAESLQGVIEKINEHHATKKELYNVV